MTDRQQASLLHEHRALVMAMAGLVGMIALVASVHYVLTERKQYANEDVVLATVNGTPVTEYEVQVAVESSLGQLGMQHLPAGAERKMLQSLIQQRALAQAAEAELSEQQRFALEKKVAAYREQLLVKLYLARHAPPKKMSEAELRRYYDAHPDRFGATKVRTYELLGTKREVVGRERVEVLRALESARTESPWRHVYRRLSDGGLPVLYRREEVSAFTLDPKLRQVLHNLKRGETSSLVYVQGRVYVARIVEESMKPPRPFSAVRDQIAKSVRPVEYREAVRQAAEEVMKGVEVEVTEAGRARFRETRQPHPNPEKHREG